MTFCAKPSDSAEPNSMDADSLETRSAMDLSLLGFALTDCVIEIDRAAAKYLRAVHRTALELATPNCFGAEIGGFWLMQEQLTQLRKLPDFYPLCDGPAVARAVEAYIEAQLPVGTGNHDPRTNTKEH